MKCSFNADNMRLAGLILLLQTIRRQNKRINFIENIDFCLCVIQGNGCKLIKSMFLFQP